MLLPVIKFLIFVAIILTSGCMGGANYAPVVDRKDGAYVESNRYIVSPGETLYSIAWRYNIDFKQLARTNGIGSPYTIYPGQSLALKMGGGRGAITTNAASKKHSSSANIDLKKRRSVSSASSSKVMRKTTFSLDKTKYPFRWQWPANANISRQFRSTGTVHKGIDLRGKLGESVRAANSGKVVYAGSGLVGYGKLLIIKHDDHYLSAYGHNSQLLVVEGQMVKVGMQIAKMGDTGASEVKLHFEIRRDGKPVNPIKLLPHNRLSR